MTSVRTRSPSWSQGTRPTSRRSTSSSSTSRDVLGSPILRHLLGNTDRQTKAIHDRIHLGIKKEHGVLPRGVEGLAEARWILMDYLESSSTSSGRTPASSTGSSSSRARPRSRAVAE